MGNSNEANAIGKFCRSMRKKNGYKQQDIAEWLHITRQCYCHYETGKVNPPITSLRSLAVIYSIPVSYLVDMVTSYRIEDNYAFNGGMWKDINLLEEKDLKMRYVDEIELYENCFEYRKKCIGLDFWERQIIYRFGLMDMINRKKLVYLLYMNNSI